MSRIKTFLPHNHQRYQRPHGVTAHICSLNALGDMSPSTYPKSRRKLVGHRLLYAISVFASLGVFLVSSCTFFASCTSLAHLKQVRIWSRVCSCHYIALLLWLTLNSVMSGIITGPHFLKFFGTPNAIEVGTMVAVLEIGAFSEFPFLIRPKGFWPVAVTSLAAGRIGDIIGRRGTLFSGAVYSALEASFRP